MRYLTLYFQSSPIVCIDLRNPKRIDLIDGIYYAEKFNLDGHISNYKNIFKAKFRRTAESNDAVTSRQIVWQDLPKRISSKEVISLIESLMKRGKDLRKRNIHPNSLANLRPSRPFTSEHRPQKALKLSIDQLEKAKELRENGCSWRKVGDILGCNCQTVRSSLRRYGVNSANSSINFKPKT